MFILEDEPKKVQEEVSHETDDNLTLKDMLDKINGVFENLSVLSESIDGLRKEIRGDEKADEPEPEKDVEPEPEKDVEPEKDEHSKKSDDEELDEIKEGLGL